MTEKWLPWEPPALVRRPTAGAAQPVAVRALPCTWFSNEVGRAVVRATELALQAQTLLDRDTARLLNTLTNIAELSGRKAVDSRGRPNGVPEQWAFQWTAGIMVRYLVELGLGVRHCPPDRIDWYFEPCVRLICLQREFHTAADRSDHARALAVGAGAGAVLVADALVSARASVLGSAPDESRRPRILALLRTLTGEKQDGTATSEPGGLDEPALSDVVDKLHRAAGELIVADLDREEVLALISEGRLESRERASTYVSARRRFETLFSALARPSPHEGASASS